MRTMLLLGCAIVTCASVQSALAHTSIYTTTLNGPNEFPSNPSLGTGTAKVTVDYDLLTMRVQATFSGLIGNTTASHIRILRPIRWLA